MTSTAVDEGAEMLDVGGESRINDVRALRLAQRAGYRCGPCRSGLPHNALRPGAIHYEPEARVPSTTSARNTRQDG